MPKLFIDAKCEKKKQLINIKIKLLLNFFTQYISSFHRKPDIPIRLYNSVHLVHLLFFMTFMSLPITCCIKCVLYDKNGGLTQLSTICQLYRVGSILCNVILQPQIEHFLRGSEYVQVCIACYWNPLTCLTPPHLVLVPCKNLNFQRHTSWLVFVFSE